MDKDRYAEDLEGNLRLVEALAPIHCTQCNGYHLARAKKRLGMPPALDRAEIVQLIHDRVMRHGTSAPFEILIAGVGDSNLLVMAAEAVADAVPTRYTVLDHCRTPLAVCEAYARGCGLALQTWQVDMIAPAGTFAADIIVVHSLLRFLPQDAHPGILKALRQWLRPGGAIVFSHRLAGGESAKAFHRSEYDTGAPLLALFEATGLRVVMCEEPTEKGGPRRRLLAVLEPV